MVATDEERHGLIPAPEEAPLILLVPEGTRKRMTASLREYAARADTAEALILGGRYTAAIGKLSDTSITTRLLDLVRIIRNGDLDVDELVLSRIPEDYSWVSWLGLKQTLGDFDARLRAPIYQGAGSFQDRFGETAVQVVLTRLVKTGVLKRHAGGGQLRLAKPGDKLPPLEQRW